MWDEIDTVQMHLGRNVHKICTREIYGAFGEERFTVQVLHMDRASNGIANG